MGFFANKDIILCSLRSHIHVSGNEKYAAKSASDMPRIKDGVPCTDCINQYGVFFPHFARLLEWCSCKQASFSQAGSGRLPVFLQAV